MPESERLAWASLGGSAAQGRVMPAAPNPDLRSRKHAMAYLATIVGSVVRGDLSPRVAREAIYGISVARGWHGDDVVARIQEAEEALAVLAKRSPGLRVGP